MSASAITRDAYIARIQLKSGKVFTARMIDQCPGYAVVPSIVPSGDDVHYSVALRRAPYCDSIKEGAEIKCFEVVHSSWRIPKSAEDQWWK